MTDRELLSAHLAGDPDAFGKLITRHIDLIHAATKRTQRALEHLRQ